MDKLKDEIWDDESVIAFRNTFSGAEGKHTFVNMLFELGFGNDEVGKSEDGSVTLESAIEGNALRNHATTLLRRLAGDDEGFDTMIAGLLKSVIRIKKENKDG